VLRSHKGVVRIFIDGKEVETCRLKADMEDTNKEFFRKTGLRNGTRLLKIVNDGGFVAFTEVECWE
jgi:hypothetical protein